METEFGSFLHIIKSVTLIVSLAALVFLADHLRQKSDLSWTGFFWKFVEYGQYVWVILIPKKITIAGLAAFTVIGIMIWLASLYFSPKEIKKEEPVKKEGPLDKAPPKALDPAAPAKALSIDDIHIPTMPEPDDE